MIMINASKNLRQANAILQRYFINYLIIIRINSEIIPIGKVAMNFR